MKALYRKVFSKNVRNRIYRLRLNVLRFLKQTGVAFVSILPSSVRIFLKEHIQVVHKMDYPKADIFINVSSSTESKLRTHSCLKEPETIEWIENMISPGDVFYDIGANIGAYSLVAARFHKGDVQVFAFEPSFLNFDQLNRNIYLNHCESTITPVHVALAEKKGVGRFYYHNLKTGGALHSFGNPLDCHHKPFIPVYSQTIYCYSIDELIEEFNMPAPHHIKLDVDGTELDILKGAQRTLSRPQVKTILVEVDSNDDAIMEYLNQKGFELHSIHSQGGDDEGKMYNCIFIRRS